MIAKCDWSVFDRLSPQVLDYDLQRQLVPYMKKMVPLPGIYNPDFIAANQDARADNIVKGSKKQQVWTSTKAQNDLKHKPYSNNWRARVLLFMWFKLDHRNWDYGSLGRESAMIPYIWWLALLFQVFRGVDGNIVSIRAYILSRINCQKSEFHIGYWVAQYALKSMCGLKIGILYMVWQWVFFYRWKRSDRISGTSRLLQVWTRSLFFGQQIQSGTAMLLRV